MTKLGGYVGLNEMTWIKTPPPTELVEYYYRTTGAKPETPENWKELLETSGLKNVIVRNYELDIVNDFIDRIRRLGSEDFSRALCRFLSLSISSPEFRRYMKETLPPLRVTKDMLKFLGYGIYVGRKRARTQDNWWTFECKDIESKQAVSFDFEMLGMLEVLDSAYSAMKDSKDILFMDLDNQGKWGILTKNQINNIFRGRR